MLQSSFAGLQKCFHMINGPVCGWLLDPASWKITLVSWAEVTEQRKAASAAQPSRRLCADWSRHSLWAAGALAEQRRGRGLCMALLQAPLCCPHPLLLGQISHLLPLMQGPGWARDLSSATTVANERQKRSLCFSKLLKWGC